MTPGGCSAGCVRRQETRLLFRQLDTILLPLPVPLLTLVQKQSGCVSLNPENEKHEECVSMNKYIVNEQANKRINTSYIYIYI